MASDQRAWQRRGRNLLRAEMTRRGLGHKDLSLRLSRLGIHMSDRTVMRRMSRATFSAAFMLQVLAAIGVKSIDLEI